MTIGENIRQYRRQKNLTQTQLANMVGVSVQAVSKWETGSGMPDISQIVPLAQVLGITTDELLCFNVRHREFEQLWQHTLKEQGDDPEKLLEISKQALEKYPNDKTFLYRAAVDEERLSQISGDDTGKHDHLDRAMWYACKLLDIEPENENAKELLVSVYASLGMDEEAVTLAYKCKNSDRALKCCLKGGELRRHRQKIVDKKLQTLLNELTNGPEDMLDTAEEILNTVFPDGNYQHYSCFLTRIYLERAKIQTDSGDEEAATHTLRKLLDFAEATDAAEKTRTNFTTPLFDMLTSPQKPAGVPGNVQMLLHFIKNEFPQLEDVFEMSNHTK